MASVDDRSEKTDVEQEPYVRPTMTLIGNMNDLLAAGGTQESDAGAPCIVGGLNDDPDCN
jgi:hypothetical protein